ncbi:MAG: class I SAM-dependent methyltransferase [Deltaproteobacteria bacterium]|nr:class I SAM-dependent methyltransferase [Deltaproteobacteria bacterium]
MKCDISKESYLERFQEYLDFEKIVKSEYLVIGKVLAETIKTALGNVPRVRVLDVGCGDGRMASTLVTLFACTQMRLIFDFLDPVEEALTLYERNVPEAHRGARIRGDWVSYDLKQPYDAIIANNSLCGFDTRETEGLRRFETGLKAGGVTLITLPSVKSDWVTYARQLWPSVHGARFGKTVFEDLASRFDCLGINHEDRFVEVPVRIEKTGCDAALKAIFSMMMYVDREQIEAQWLSDYRWFKRGILWRQGFRMKFVYGITTVRRGV